MSEQTYILDCFTLDYEYHEDLPEIKKAVRRGRYVINKKAAKGNRTSTNSLFSFHGGLYSSRVDGYVQSIKRFYSSIVEQVQEVIRK